MSGSLKDIYGTMGMTSFKNQYSKWVWASLARWRSHIDPVFGSGHVLVSNHANCTDKTAAAVLVYERFLDQHTVSTVGLVHLLVRWAFCGSVRGGLREAKLRKAASDLLQALVGLLAEKKEGMRLALIFSPDWVCRWPRPNGVGGGAVCSELVVDCSGFVDLSALFALAGDLVACTVARKWRGLLCRDVAMDAATTGRLHILEVLRQASPVKELDSLCAQLVWALSKEVERRLAYSQGGAGVDATTPVRAGFLFREQSIRAAGGDLDLQLYRYVSATVEESSKWNCIGISTDKASPCSGSISNTAISFPGGKVAVACPQALLVRCRVDSGGDAAKPATHMYLSVGQFAEAGGGV